MYAHWFAYISSPFFVSLLSLYPINAYAPGKIECNFRHVIFKQILVTSGWGNSCEIVLIWMSLDVIHDQSTLVHVMTWCRQAASHYLSRCWPRPLSPYSVTRPQCVNVKTNYSKDVMLSLSLSIQRVAQEKDSIQCINLYVASVFRGFALCNLSFMNLGLYHDPVDIHL